jgi:hypothetical protein
MCPRRRRAIVTAMAETSITIVLSLDGTTDSPSGSARLADGTEREFHGWLGLAEAIDALVRTHVDVKPVKTPKDE